MCIAQNTHGILAAEMMEGEGAEDKIPCAVSPVPDISLMKMDFRKVPASLNRNGKGCRIQIHSINAHGNFSILAPCHDFTGEISFTGCKIQYPEWPGMSGGGAHPALQKMSQEGGGSKAPVQPAEIGKIAFEFRGGFSF